MRHSKSIHKLFILATLSMIAWSAPPRTCEALGGCSSKKGCECLEGKVIRPETDSCTLVDLTTFCEHPGRTLCHSPKQSEMREIRSEFDRIEKTVFDEVKKEVVAVNEKLDAWHPDSPYFERFHEEVSRRMQAQMITDKREAKSREQFERARSTLKQYLNDRIKLFEPAPDLPPEADWTLAPGEAESKIATLREMVRRIDKATLSFRVTSSNTKRGNNAFNAAAFRDTQSVSLGGLILEADNAPESLFLVLLHELGHLIDPDSFKNDISNPFDRENNCLKGQRKFGRNTSLLNEAFADWVSVESYRSLNNIKFSYPMREFTARENARLTPACRRTPLGSVLDLGQVTNLRQLQGLISYDCTSFFGQNETHPASIDRIEGIILAHPQFSHAMGCQPKITKPGSSNSGGTDGTTYCGLDLYQKPEPPINPIKLLPIEPIPDDELPQEVSPPKILFKPSKHPFSRRPPPENPEKNPQQNH